MQPRLSLSMLLPLLEAQHQSCTLLAEVSDTLFPEIRTRNIRETYHIELGVSEGQLLTCLLRDALGHIVQEGIALVPRIAQVELAWTLQSLEPPSPALTPFETAGSLLLPPDLVWVVRVPPCRVKQIPPDVLGSLPRKHRQVLFLIDGCRNAAHIQHLSHCDAEQFAAILDTLMAHQLIAFQIDNQFIVL